MGHKANTILLVDFDHRPSTSLNGDWRTIVDQYSTSIYTLIRSFAKMTSSWMPPSIQNGHPQDYNFANAATLRVPGYWNTQRPELLYYEGPIWYEKVQLAKKMRIMVEP
ncbi:hypothetical protein [Tunturibacter empetritectus]|uniref:Uncharacterized protein n=1 Tax=Tunturiibacter lichenicola TaxID=2051959 RepID=A0A7W8JB00_9BACT|nr:hypothetical protein [Edaphobacter lichenicola]MBB5344579.1 hypothetical protein [Edaphobacter lichenicola]